VYASGNLQQVISKMYSHNKIAFSIWIDAKQIQPQFLHVCLPYLFLFSFIYFPEQQLRLFNQKNTLPEIEDKMADKILRGALKMAPT
jgi:hypothetical protein